MIYRMDEQQGPAVSHRELQSTFCDKPEWKRIRAYTCITIDLLYSRNKHNIVNQLYLNKIDENKNKTLKNNKKPTTAFQKNFSLHLKAARTDILKRTGNQWEIDYFLPYQETKDVTVIRSCSHRLRWAGESWGNSGYEKYPADQRHDCSEPRLLHLPIHRKVLNSLTWCIWFSFFCCLFVCAVFFN